MSDIYTLKKHILVLSADSDMNHMLPARLDELSNLVTQDTFEWACKVVCEDCHINLPESINGGAVWVHDGADYQLPKPCKATDLREAWRAKNESWLAQRVINQCNEQKRKAHTNR